VYAVWEWSGVVRINSRQKGKRGELEACRFMAERTGLQWRRTAQVRGHTDGAADIEPCTPDQVWSAIHIEVKRTETIGIGTRELDAACEQAERDASGKPWMVLWRGSRAKWMMTLRVMGRLIHTGCPRAAAFFLMDLPRTLLLAVKSNFTTPLDR